MPSFTEMFSFHQESGPSGDGGTYLDASRDSNQVGNNTKTFVKEHSVQTNSVHREVGTSSFTTNTMPLESVQTRTMPIHASSSTNTRERTHLSRAGYSSDTTVRDMNRVRQVDKSPDRDRYTSGTVPLQREGGDFSEKKF